MQAPLFCYQLESSMRMAVVIQSILADAWKHNRLAQQMAAWIKMNLRGLRMHYAQELERKCPLGPSYLQKRIRTS